MRKLVLLLALALFTAPLIAQTDRANLTGVVMDTSKSVIPGATVTLHAIATGIDYVARTNSTGVYTLTGLPIGDYSTHISAKGFATQDIQTFSLNVGETRTMNATLKVAAVTSAVTVVDAAPNLTLNTAEIGGVIEHSQIAQLPVNGRYWAELAVMIPGATQSGTGTQNNLRFTNLSQEDNNFRLDGVDTSGMNHAYIKDPLHLQVPMESIAEFKASSAVYSADTGGQAGGQVNMVSRGGSNAFHGSFYEYLRNDAFDALDYKTPTAQSFKMNNFGVSLGGPILKDRFFFFANYESQRQAFQSLVSGNIPTDSYRAQIAQSNPDLGKLLAAFPEPAPGDVPLDPTYELYKAVKSAPVTENAGLIRLDYEMNPRTAVSFRFNTDAYQNLSPNLVQSEVVEIYTPNAVLEVQNRITPSFINDAKFGYNRDNYNDGGQGNILPFGFSVGNAFSYSLCDCSWRIDNGYSVTDDATLEHGRHTFKFGIEMRHLQENKLHPPVPPTYSWQSEQDFENNAVQEYDYNAPNLETAARKTPIYSYFLDEFKIRPNVTLNAGLRYEYYGVDREKHSSINQIFAPFDCGTWNAPCPAGTPFYYSNWTDLEPRVSIAWAPAFLHGKTAIRAGYGKFYGDGQFGALYASQPRSGTSYVFQAPNCALAYPVNDPSTVSCSGSSGSGGSAFPDFGAVRDLHRKDIDINQWTISVQHEVLRDTILQVAYVGTTGRNLFQKEFPINLINPATGKRQYEDLGANPDANLLYDTGHGFNNYNALQVTLRRNMSRGLLVTANYQYAHGLGNGADGGAEGNKPQNMDCFTCMTAADWAKYLSSDMNGEYGPTSVDLRHIFSASAVWTLPVGRGRSLLTHASPLVDGILGGWQLSGIGTARTGLPLTVSYKPKKRLPDGSTSERPDIVPGVPLYVHGDASNGNALWVNTDAFAAPAVGAFGNSSRGALLAPGIWQADMSLQKRFNLTERIGFSIRADSFNVFNTAELGKPNTTFGNASFGQISGPFTTTAIGTGTARQFQFSARLEY
ncbi:MAG TPA: carboxypeptidase regulatory-like domain-containing protein [Terracidiphilus sp.]|nr:carboxypeptidase regulatory-like domain-containing protein [Terracidiphilus sp.]